MFPFICKCEDEIVNMAQYVTENHKNCKMPDTEKVITLQKEIAEISKRLEILKLNGGVV